MASLVPTERRNILATGRSAPPLVEGSRVAHGR